MNNFTTPLFICAFMYGLISFTYANLEYKGYERVQGCTGECYEEYVKVLEKCKYFLINTERQIGLGNILFFLYYGGFVVIRKNNPVVEWMSELEIPFTELDSSDFVLVKGGDLETKSTLLSFWGKETKRSLTIDYLAKIGS
ncbi:MAG TPA: hypothetical protein DHU93_15575 [Algoriphagus sp.]|nr:hypothetical protein [Algoriphagus sp.]